VRKALSFLSIVSLIAFVSLAGCGDSANSANSVPMIVTIQDQAPSGFTVLSFGIQITNITLKGASGQEDATLVSSPITVNLANLMTVDALIANTTVPAGTYSSLMITFSSPQLTVINNSGTTFSDGTNSCTTTTVSTTSCKLSPKLTQATVTVSSSPFPLTVTAGTPIHLAIDFKTGSSINNASGTISINPSVTVSTSTTVNTTTKNIADFTSATGQVTAVGNNQVVVTDMSTGQSLTLASTSSTTFQGFQTSSTCTTANTFGCLATGQLINFNFGISGASGSTPTLQSVSLNTGVTNGITGTVVSANHTTNQFEVLVTGIAPGSTVTGVSVGQMILVNPSPTATFSAQTNGVTLPSGLTFAGVSNVGVGQTVLLNSTGFTAGTGSAPGTLTANNVVLIPSQFSGTVGTVNSTSQTFTLTGLNGVFTLNAIPTVVVDTGTNTSFFGVTGLTALTPGTVATTGGLVFVTPTGVVVFSNQVGTL
jgi:hypothetical protein